ncbi:hypothetical protein B0G77_8128 [Paraburkholderia sp. BL10I2N1]|nr:hypothetical protein B0G77_8128 [Paraburkholderia sp. BL10I2N1]
MLGLVTSGVGLTLARDATAIAVFRRQFVHTQNREERGHKGKIYQTHRVGLERLAVRCEIFVAAAERRELVVERSQFGVFADEPFRAGQAMATRQTGGLCVSSGGEQGERGGSHACLSHGTASYVGALVNDSEREHDRYPIT